MLERAAGIPLLELTLRVALGEEIRIDGPVATERIGYRFFLQPPAVSATVAAITGVDSGQRPSRGGHHHRAPGARAPTSTGRTDRGTTSWRWSARPTDYAELQAVNRLLHKEVTVTYADVRH